MAPLSQFPPRGTAAAGLALPSHGWGQPRATRLLAPKTLPDPSRAGMVVKHITTRQLIKKGFGCETWGGLAVLCPLILEGSLLRSRAHGVPRATPLASPQHGMALGHPITHSKLPRGVSLWKLVCAQSIPHPTGVAAGTGGPRLCD